MDTEIITLPVIPTRGLVVYPLSTTQYDVSSKKAVIALTESIKKRPKSIYASYYKCT